MILKELDWVTGVEPNDSQEMAVYYRVGQSECSGIQLRLENYGDHGLLFVDVYINDALNCTLTVKNGVSAYGYPESHPLSVLAE